MDFAVITYLLVGFLSAISYQIDFKVRQWHEDPMLPTTWEAVGVFIFAVILWPVYWLLVWLVEKGWLE